MSDKMLYMTDSPDGKGVAMYTMNMPLTKAECMRRIMFNFPNGDKFTSNFIFLPQEIRNKYKPKYFILDANDIQFIKEKLKKTPNDLKIRDCLLSVDNFLKHKEKQIIFRYFLSPVDSSKLFLTADMLELFPIIARQEGDKLKDKEFFLRYCYEHFGGVSKDKTRLPTTSEHEFLLTTNLMALKTVLINQDLNFRESEPQMIHKTANIVTVFSPDGDLMVYPSHGVYKIFCEVAVGYTMDLMPCRKCPNCAKVSRLKTLEMMNEYAGMDQNSFILLSRVEADISKLTSLPIHKNPHIHVDLTGSMDPVKYDDLIPLTMHEKTCEEAKITNHSDLIRSLVGDDQPAPVWMTTVFMIVAFMQSFIEPDMNELKEVLLLVVQKKIPEEMRERIMGIIRALLFPQSYNKSKEQSVQTDETLLETDARQENQEKQLLSRICELRDVIQEKDKEIESMKKENKGHLNKKNERIAELEKEALEKNVIVSLLQSTNIRVSVEDEEQTSNAQNLLNRLLNKNR